MCSASSIAIQLEVFTGVHILLQIPIAIVRVRVTIIKLRSAEDQRYCTYPSSCQAESKIGFRIVLVAPDVISLLQEEVAVFISRFGRNRDMLR